ncbi:MAG: Uma2 family endonuclease [Phototrophicaceae bacterium]|jgi:Uma2 family endonuclease
MAFLVQPALMTVEDFERFAELPENADKMLEWVDGEVFQVPSNTFASNIAQLIGFFIRLWIRENGIKGYVTEGQGGYKVGSNRFAPDVGYISAARQATLTRQGYNELPPELAVEVISAANNTQELHILRRKVTAYLAVGCVVWVVDPFNKTLEVHAPAEAPRLYDEASTLSGEPVFPAFRLALTEIFSEAA